MMKFNDFQKYMVTLHIPYEKYFELIYETKYLLEARLKTGRIFEAQKFFYGCNRRSVVAKAVQWYNQNLKQALGHPHMKMFIDDPLTEVVYDDGFVCTDLRNKFLDDATIERLLTEANGDLGRGDSGDSSKIQLSSVIRLRKRRKFETVLTDHFIQSSGGTIYYQMADLPQGRGTRFKVRKIKLSSKSLEKAKKEVVRRGLNKFEKFANTKEILQTKSVTDFKAA